jgi:hypothetical protein
MCAGSKCSCIAELQIGQGSGSDTSDEMAVRRSDGTIWVANVGNIGNQTPFTEVVKLSGAPLIASAVAVQGGTHGVPSGSGWQNQPPKEACAIVSAGAVWCFPLYGALTDSTFLGAGLGPADSTSAPVQVLTGVGGAPLLGAQQISAGEGPSFCAVTSDGSIWCWGYGADGQLGWGDGSNANYARQVHSGGATPFTSAVEVRMGVESACARKTDGSVWCWGTNTSGELGVAYSTTTGSDQPIQVPFIGTADQRTATRLASGAYGSTPCAIMKDTGVVCWGWSNP